MNAVRTSNGRRQLVFEGAPFECSKEFVDISNEDVCRPYELHVEAGIQHIGRGHTCMHKPRFRSDDFGQMGQESDDVMLDLCLDFINAGNVELRGIAFFPDFLCGLFRDSAELRHGVRRVSFDLKPDSEFGFRRPDRSHLRAGIARDGHAASPRARAAALRITAMLPLLLPPLNTADPATNTFAPACTTRAALSEVIPPSIAISMGRAPTSVRTSRSLSMAAGMNA